MSVAAAPAHTVRIGTHDMAYQRRWTGQRLSGKTISLDTETAVVDHAAAVVPGLALAAVSDGRVHAIIHPDDLGRFLAMHHDRQFVMHNAAFDYWVIWEHLAERRDYDALAVLLTVVGQRRLHDTMLLDMLIRLASFEASGGQAVPPRPLDDVVRDYTGYEISKNDPYRLRYAEIIDKPWEHLEAGFFEYAIKDPITTHLAYQQMKVIAEDFYRPHEHLAMPDARHRFGLLTESLQVEAAIALAQIERNGMHVNRTLAEEVDNAERAKLDVAAAEMLRLFPGVIKVGNDGRPLPTEKSGAPQRSKKELERRLLEAAEAIKQVQPDFVVPLTEKGNVSQSVDAWIEYEDVSPFIKNWAALEQTSKRRQFFATFQTDTIHPKYSVLVRTGRTSCSKPNMQQIPRDDAFRQLIVPPPGCLLLIVDYRYVELVTLAATCKHRFGFSKLGDIIRSGVDPHCYTAALLIGMSLDEFMALEHSDPKRYKQLRQQAKPINFGVPGGLGAETLVDYAWSTYGVELSIEQAEEFHRRLTTEIYPELGHYLGDSGMACLAQRLGVAEAFCWDALSINGDREPSTITVIRKILSGNPKKVDGSPYNAEFVEEMWRKLHRLNHNADLNEVLAARVGSPGLAVDLLGAVAVTLSGRVRAGTEYTAQRNTPFQGLAGDGAKVALCRLVLKGHRVVGFVHDEILIELLDQGGYVPKAEVDSIVDIIKSSMQEFTGDVPVDCEYALSTCWSKSAKLIVDGDRVLPWAPDVANNLSSANGADVSSVCVDAAASIIVGANN